MVTLNLFVEREVSVLTLNDFCFCGKEKFCIFTLFIRNQIPLYQEKLAHLYFFARKYVAPINGTVSCTKNY